MGDGLVMNLRAVSSLSSELGKTNTLLAKEFTAIENAMNALGSSWNDNVGSDFTAQFASFIEQSSEINDLIKSIKSNIDKNVSKASNAYNTALRNMM